MNCIKKSAKIDKAIANLHASADKILVQHIRRLGEASVGDTVQIELADVDRGPLDFRYILAYITEVNTERSTYRLCTSHGFIKGWRSRNEFVIQKQVVVVVV